MTIQCTKCKYKLPPHRKESLKCPYCSAEGTLQKEQTAQDILDNVNDEIIVMDESKKERDESDFNF
ncbi:hypothetical protein GOV08_05390 [Candidatus Woesearchaeota archaeon]|nr:hypothetical protein [Candidatus Woesearchaeota archaeon]